MDKSVAGLIGALGVVAAASPSHAATSLHAELQGALQASSYADLLKPVPNAAALQAALLASRAAEAGDGAPEATLVQYHHHHHHHHHRYRRWRRRYHHHHHHHHHNNGVVIVP